MRRVRLVFAPLLFILLIGTTIAIARAANDNNYLVTVLVSNQAADHAPFTDANLVNAWGITATATSPWWVANNGTNTSTIYRADGSTGRPPVAVPGAPTGIVAYTGTAFLLAPNRPARFIWAAEDGTISAWNPQFDANNAHVEVPSDGGIYKGLAIHGNVLYTTDFASCEVETIDGTWNEFDTGGFEDDSIPENFCPFGIQVVGTSVFVSYALRGGLDDISGVSHGFVREFDLNGNLIAKVADRGLLNSPWGMALAPAGWGAFGGCLIVGNFGDGALNAYCEDQQGNFHHAGKLKNRGHDLHIDGLWGIGFGNGSGSGPTNVLYFAAGPNDESDGRFGKIAAVR
jgi:uncharacterized protein (TIGR03118 family)